MSWPSNRGIGSCLSTKFQSPFNWRWGTDEPRWPCWGTIWPRGKLSPGAWAAESWLLVMPTSNSTIFAPWISPRGWQIQGSEPMGYGMKCQKKLLQSISEKPGANRINALESGKHRAWQGRLLDRRKCPEFSARSPHFEIQFLVETSHCRWYGKSRIILK